MRLEATANNGSPLPPGGRGGGRGVEEPLVGYSSEEPSAFAHMLGGLIEANVLTNPKKRQDFDRLVARVGVWVTDIDEGVTLVFEAGKLSVYNGLEAPRP